MQNIKWQVANRSSDDLLTQLLLNRNLERETDQTEFLNPPKPTFDYIFSYSHIDFQNFQKAIARVKKAIKNKEKIIIYGDYDADGITGTTVLWEAIYYAGGNCFPYIPDRSAEGYGLNKEAINKLFSEKVRLIITVDCGITAGLEVEVANSLGIDVIITDHHQKGKKLPESFSIIYDDSLVGVSVAWVLAMGIKKEFPSQKSESKTDDLDLVAIGTIADLQPLLFKNRSFVKWGLQALNKTERLGLRLLIDQSQLPWGEIDTYHVGYIIAPRLNATGRLQDGLSAVRLLCTKNELQALELSDSLSKINTQRQELTVTSFEEAEMQINIADNKKIFVLTHELWHEGIVGLVASRIKEKYYRPTLAISTQGKVGKGSARSIKGFNIINALREMEDLLIDCGGHPMAAGFTIDLTKIEEFRKRLEEFTEKSIEPSFLEPLLEIDAEVKVTDLNWELKKTVDKLKPFGVGNPEPLFLLRNVTVNKVSLIGKMQNHLKFKIGNLEVLGFGFGSIFPEVTKNPKIDLVFSLNESTWNGTKKLFLKVKDLHFGS